MHARGRKLNTLLQRLMPLRPIKCGQKMPEILQWQRDRLLQRFDEIQLQVDPQREQEMVLLAQRVDVAEELGSSAI